MTDRVHPSSKPNGTGTAKPSTTSAVATTNPPLKFPPATKTHLHNHPYRPTPTSRHRHNGRRFTCRRCCCLTCFWSILLLIAILLLAAICAAAFYVLYNPHHPAFSVTSLKITQFNITTTADDDTTHLTTKFNLTISSRNPNKKIIYTYNPISITVFSNQVNLSTGSFTNFTSLPNNIFIIHTTTGLTSQILDVDSVTSLKSDLKKKKGLPMKILMDTNLGIKMEKLKMKNIGIQVICYGIHGIVPKSKNATVADTSDAKCKVDLRIKILKWSF
ncbi:Late embryogenesis abundant [Forsythia ovata]|uniref:Late embryogenesis abundant n=1 Tax=Forsythia ovata TaxID=205694 RepID=A0ABD1WG39_9LAMI